MLIFDNNDMWHFSGRKHGPEQNGGHFANNIFNCIFVNEYACILIEISLLSVSNGTIDNPSVLVYIMAWCYTGDKPLYDPMLTWDLWVMPCTMTRPQNVNLQNPICFIKKNSAFKGWMWFCMSMTCVLLYDLSMSSVLYVMIRMIFSWNECSSDQIRNVHQSFVFLALCAAADFLHKGPVMQTGLSQHVILMICMSAFVSRS